MKRQPSDLHWHNQSITVQNRRKEYGYKSCVIWLTGLSASGKSTLANRLCEQFHQIKVKSYVLDGDNLRHGLNQDLGFTPRDRRENIRRIAEVAKLFVDAGLIVITAFISPYREEREKARKLMDPNEFIEVFVSCPISICQERDPKGMYKKALKGLIKDFTGIDAPYESPDNPEIIIRTDQLSIDDCIKEIISYLYNKNYINLPTS